MINVPRPEVIPFPYGLSVAFFRGGPTKWDDPGPAGVALSNNLNRVTIHHNPPSQKGHYKLYNPKVLGNCSNEKVCFSWKSQNVLVDFFSSQTFWVQNITPELWKDGVSIHHGRVCGPYSQWTFWEAVSVKNGSCQYWRNLAITTWWDFNYQPQLVFPPDFWTINRTSSTL